MLWVIIIWLYVLAISYVLGHTGLRIIEKICNRECGNISIKASPYLMTGLVLLTVYAQIVSLFYKVGLVANVILVILCIVLAIRGRAPIGSQLMEQWSGLSRATKIIGVLLFLLFAYGTSRGIIHYDTSLYHAQSIRWIEEYGIVKGLGNLHGRLSYNSASFSLSALFSFSFLGAQSFHVMAGLFALLLALCCLNITNIFKNKKIRLSDFAKIMAIYYLLIIFDEMVSPASDYFTVITVFYMIICWLRLVEKKEKDWFPYALLCLLGVYTMSLKLSAALILLLVLKPALQMVREKKGKEIICFIFLGILIIAPFLIRNVIISGWLVYPFAGVDLFSFDWKMPEHIVVYDAKEIQVWGRGLYDVSQYKSPIWQWFGIWFRQQSMLDRLFVLADIGAVILLPFIAVFVLWKKKEKYVQWIFVSVVLALCFLFWLSSAPLMRYGCVYVWLTAAVFYGGILQPFMTKAWFTRIIFFFVGVAFLYKALTFLVETTSSFEGKYFINQKEYDNFETVPYEIDGISFFYPKEGDRVGYKDFPSAPRIAPVVLRGETLADGFRTSEKVNSTK